MTFKEFVKENIFLKLIFITFIIFLFYTFINKSPADTNEYKDWTKYVHQNTRIFSTEDWFTYNETGQIGNFSIGLPNNLKIDKNIFTDNSGQKIGEFSPGLVDLKPNQDCFDTEWNNENGESEFISLKNIKIGMFKGKLLIEKS